MGSEEKGSNDVQKDVPAVQDKPKNGNMKTTLFICRLRRSV